MSILIKSDELNYLIYKYLQEAGLNHTAFSFYNQAALQPIMVQFKYNTEAGQLISLLQKGLILTQIQSHIVLDDFHQCKVPFNLIRPHHCKIVEKVQQLKQKTQDEFKKQINDSIQRTIDVIKAVPNPQPCQPDIEGKQRNFLEELYKLKFKCQPEDIYYCSTTQTLSVNQKEQNKLTFLKYNRQDQIFQVDAIIPTYFGNSLKPIQAHSHNSRFIIIIFPENNVILLETRTYSILKMFQLKVNENQVRKIHWHPKQEHIVALQFDNLIKIFNIQQLAVMMSLYGKLFEWKYVDEFVYFNGTQIEHKTLSGNLLNAFKSEDNIDELKLSKDKQFILTVCHATNTARMYTFLSEDHLFVFEEVQPIKTVNFAVSKNATYILILTQNGLKIWDVQLSQLKQQLVQQERFSNVSVINLNDKAYSILLAQQAVILHDISSNRKATRGLNRFQQQQPQVFKLKQLGEQQCVLVGNGNIYIITKRMIEPVF